jgi:uncharacterized protein DUF1360
LKNGSAASTARRDLGFAVRFTVASLATWRVTHLLAEEDGPADLVVRARAALGDGTAGALMDCFYCLSVWVAAPLSLTVTRRCAQLPTVWLGLSAGACLIDRLTAPSTTRAGDDVSLTTS